MPLQRGVLALAKAKSENAKIGKAATTYAAQASCPRSCVFFDGGGCYAEDGMVYAGTTKPLNETAEDWHASKRDVAVAEAAAIDEMDVQAGFPMRLHTVGDCATDEAARIVSAACERYMARGGGPVWTYTHGWRTVRRESWGRVSVLASCETAEQAELARANGYAPSIVVDEFPSRKLYVAAGGLEVLPCPAQTTHAVCSSCRLCFDDQGLLGRGYAIGFEVHGSAFAVRQARRSLEAPSDPGRRQTLRDLLPGYLAANPGASNYRAARDLGYAEASVGQMRTRLAVEARDDLLDVGDRGGV